jgi:hypothetical protein
MYRDEKHPRWEIARPTCRYAKLALSSFAVGPVSTSGVRVKSRSVRTWKRVREEVGKVLEESESQ